MWEARAGDIVWLFDLASYMEGSNIIQTLINRNLPTVNAEKGLRGLFYSLATIGFVLFIWGMFDIFQKRK